MLLQSLFKGYRSEKTIKNSSKSNKRGYIAILDVREHLAYMYNMIKYIKAMARKYQYHRENCNNCLRAVITDSLGRMISLYGKHAFEWEIIWEKDGKTIVHQFPNRKAAIREFNNYKKRYK